MDKKRVKSLALCLLVLAALVLVGALRWRDLGGQPVVRYKCDTWTGDVWLDYLLEKPADKRLVLLTSPPTDWLVQHPSIGLTQSAPKSPPSGFTRPLPKATAVAAVLDRYPTPEQEKQWEVERVSVRRAATGAWWFLLLADSCAIAYLFLLPATTKQAHKRQEGD